MKMENKIKELMTTFSNKKIALSAVNEILNISRMKGMYISNDAEDFYKEIKHELEKL
tara:strand:- start:3 stop:173 length:171 start_codon:yes stop_codon:yes gene_type:complete